MVPLRRFDGCAEKYQSFRRKPRRNRLKERLGIGQVLGKHGGYNALVFSATIGIISFQSIGDCKPYATSVSRYGEQTISYSHCWGADVHTFNLDVRSLFCGQKTKHAMS